MTLVYQSPVRADAVLEALASAVSPSTTAYRAAVAYVTREGAKRLVEELSSQIGLTWATAEKAIVTCFDFGTTEPGALEYLQSNGFEVRVANLGADGTIRLISNPSSFHPKVYLAVEPNAVTAVIGSANLSRRALSVNTEAVTTTELSREAADAIWAEVEANSVALTPALLHAYRELRPKQRASSPPDEPPVPAPSPPSTLPVFREAVEAETVKPEEHQAFWVEVGGPSGGSGNQLELPRRAQRFFGYTFDDYDDEHHVIGEPTLTTTTGSWSRPLTWHGNNRMERINLPTTAQSGLSYGHQIVLFQRSGSSFEITVAPPGSSRAERWRDESAAAGTLYRFSSGSQRLCGLI